MAILSNDTTIRTGQCSLCGKDNRKVEEVAIYYKNGNKMRLANLCFEVINIGSPEQRIDNCCLYKYYDDLGFQLIIAGWEEKAYNVIRSVYLSCPLLLSPKISEEKRRYNDSGLINGIPFDTAVHIAYTISHIVRQYLNAVDKKKVVHVLDVERNPRLWPIIWNMLYNDKLLVTVDKDKLIFKWSQIMI